MSDVVLDASAVLALLGNEPGAEHVETFLGRSLLCSVNLAEVVAKLHDYGIDDEEQQRLRSLLDIAIRSFDERLAMASGTLRAATSSFGLSLGDRACLALALQEGLPVLTTDRRWADLDIPVEMRVIR